MATKKTKYDENKESILNITKDGGLFRLIEVNKKSNAEKKLIVHKGGNLADFKKQCKHFKFSSQE